jgi:hypothetical protein
LYDVLPCRELDEFPSEAFSKDDIDDEVSRGVDDHGQVGHQSEMLDMGPRHTIFNSFHRV